VVASAQNAVGRGRTPHAEMLFLFLFLDGGEILPSLHQNNAHSFF
jgi:hypothetical protein